MEFAYPVSVDLSVVLLTKNEAENLKKLVPKLKSIIGKTGLKYEILVMDAGSNDGTEKVCREHGLRFHVQSNPGFGVALAEAISYSKGERILTIDADLQHDPNTIPVMLETDADVAIGSRWVGKKEVHITLPRKILSLSLNFVFSRFLKINIKDMSSNFRLYRRRVFKDIEIIGRDFDSLQEVLIKCVNNGYKIVEVPISFKERVSGKSNVALAKFLVSYMKTFVRAWRLRTSVDAVDYDEWAYNSKIPLQRNWQRERFKHVMGFVKDQDIVVDVGCGSSMIIQTLEKQGRGIGADISFNRLHYLKEKLGGTYATCDAQKLCFKDDSISCLIHSNVIEHIRKPELALNECARVLKKGGYLVLATPDFGTWTWRNMERVYDFVKMGESYKHEHVSPLTKEKVKEMLAKREFEIQDIKGIFFNAEIVVKAKKN